MPYQSPLHILDSLHITPDELTPEGITRLRKKLLAEFSLSSNITIDVNGQAYTKDEILKVIDQLKEVDNLVLHKAIFSRKPLLDWLENPQKGFFPQDLAQEVLDKNLENDFYQSMLQYSMAEYVKVHFKKRHFTRLQMAVNFWENLQEEYRYEIHDVIYNEIQVVIDEIEYASQNLNISENKERFGFISEPQWTDFLNNLPANFEGIREAYCYAAVNYTVTIQRKDRKWTYEISSQLDQTLCDGSIKDTISSNHSIYADNYHGTSSSTEDSSSWSWVARIIFFVIFGLVRMSSCDNHSSSNNNSYSVPPTYDTYSSSEPPPKIAPDEPNRIENIEKEYGQIKLPANTFYIVQIQNYQKALVKNNYPHEGQKISVMKGINLLENLNLGNTEERIDAPIRVNPQMITFKNLTDYDLIIFKAGCNANRSFFINSKDTYWIETCSGDLFYFYFGKNWLQNYPNISNMQMDEKKRFQGYFSVSHKNTNAIFMKEYSFNPNGKEPTITFDNITIEKNIMPTATALGINENDTSIIVQ